MFHQSRGGVAQTGAAVDDAERIRLQLEARFYLTAIARKRDEQVARRDFRMEVAVIVMEAAVIVLIGVEIVLGLYSIREAKQESRVLQHMDQSTADTASAMKTATVSLKTVADAQAGSLANLKQTNDALNKTNTALQSQLRVLSQQQSALQQQGNLLAQQLAVQKQQWEKAERAADDFGHNGN